MKTYQYIALVYMTFLLGLGGCSSEENVSLQQQENDGRVSFQLVHPSDASSRANEAGFESSDRVGLFMTEGESPLQPSGNYVNNTLLIYNGSMWEPQTPVYWNKGTYKVYAYYPYTNPIRSVDNYSLSVMPDQRMGETGTDNYELSDFLWATSTGLTATNEPVALSFRHCMSRLDIRLVKGEDYEGDLPENAVVYVHNTVTSASADLSVGIVTKNPYGAAQTVTARALGNHRYSAILVPQRLSNRVPLVEVVMKGVSYLVESKFLFKQGICHKLNLVISKHPEQIKIEIGGELQDWE